MSTALPTQHRFSHPTAMVAAAATAVILGGSAAVGFAMSQDSTDAPSGSGTTTSTHPHQQCPDPRCLPPAQRPHGNQAPGSIQLPLNGGKTIAWLP
jgi:hypothetical protein